MLLLENSPAKKCKSKRHSENSLSKQIHKPKKVGDSQILRTFDGIKV